MKRELKHGDGGFADDWGLIAEPIPMKRELKPELQPDQSQVMVCIAEPIPMKRELKQNPGR